MKKFVFAITTLFVCVYTQAQKLPASTDEKPITYKIIPSLTTHGVMIFTITTNS
jgi:hypothetical protein